MIIFRPIKKMDIEEIVDLGDDLHNEGALSDLAYCKDTTWDFIASVISMKDTFHVCACVDHRIVGFMAGRIDQYPFGRGSIARDYVIYVIPEMRGTMIFAKMIQRYKEWAESMKADKVMLGQSSGIQVAETFSLYERLGFQCVGGFFLKVGK